MAAKPKLTAEQWAEVRQTWESDPRKGFPWLIEELGLPVSQEALRQRSKKEAWQKQNQSLENKSKLGESKQASKQPENEEEARKERLRIRTEERKEYNRALVVAEVAKRNGQPTPYMPVYDKKVYRLCLLGASIEEIAGFFNVNQDTIYNWLNQYATFSEAMHQGRLDADARMAERLYTRGHGYRYTEVKTKRVMNKEGEEVIAEIIETEKEALPDTRAASMWLFNRRPKDWRNRVEVKEEVIVANIPWEELRAITAAAVARAQEQHEAIISGRYERLGIAKDYHSD